VPVIVAELESRRVELIAVSSPGKNESARVGLGLVVGLVVARKSLLAAGSGQEQFEWAIAHFVGVVLTCVAGALLLGYLYDRSIRQTTRDRAESVPNDSGVIPDKSQIGAGTS